MGWTNEFFQLITVFHKNTTKLITTPLTTTILFVFHFLKKHHSVSEVLLI